MYDPIILNRLQANLVASQKMLEVYHQAQDWEAFEKAVEDEHRKSFKIVQEVDTKGNVEFYAYQTNYYSMVLDWIRLRE